MIDTTPPTGTGNVSILAVPGAGIGRQLSEPISEIRRARLLVIDSRSLTRDCLVAALTGAPNIISVLSAASLDEATKLLTEERVDAALVNVASDAFEEEYLMAVVNALSRKGGVDVIVLLTSMFDLSHAAAALRQGIRGFLASDTPIDVITAAIGFATSGWMIYPAFDFTQSLSRDSESLSSHLPGRDFNFTRRQRQVLDGLKHGMTNKGIALALGVSERTVKAHIKEMMQRLRANNRTQIVALVSEMVMSDVMGE